MNSHMKTRELLSILDYFPPIDLPVAFSEDAIKDISSTNPPLPGKFVYYILESWEGKYDEYSEVIPCVQLPEGDDFIPLVYWKADLYSREYILVTLQKRDLTLISRKVIAGMKSDGKTVIQSVANIEEGHIINIMVGALSDTEYDPMSSNALTMEILPGGNIYSQKEDEPLAWVEKKGNTEKS